MQKKRTPVLFLTETAMLLALLVGAQAITKPLGQLVTGSCVNAVLAVSALLVGWQSGLCIALISPFAAFLLGVGPAFFPLTPIIALGNAAYVLLIALGARGADTLLRPAGAVLVAAAAKFALLWGLVVQGVCRLMDLKPMQVQTFSAMFSWPQLTTALIGGAIALVIVPVVKTALDGRK